MPRPRLQRHACVRPKGSWYKSQGIPLRSLESISLTHEETEALWRGGSLRIVRRFAEQSNIGMQTRSLMNTHPPTLIRPPTILIMLGATGDLMARELVPALYHLFASDDLSEQSAMLGVARQEMNGTAFRVCAREALTKDSSGHGTVHAFLTYAELVWKAAIRYLRTKQH